MRLGQGTVISLSAIYVLFGHTINDGSCDAHGTFGAVRPRAADLFTKILASTRVRALHDMRDGRSGSEKITNQAVCSMEVVRSGVGFFTRWLIRRLSGVLDSIPATPLTPFQAASAVSNVAVLSDLQLGPLCSQQHCEHLRSLRAL